VLHWKKTVEKKENLTCGTPKPINTFQQLHLGYLPTYVAQAVMPHVFNIQEIWDEEKFPQTW